MGCTNRAVNRYWWKPTNKEQRKGNSGFTFPLCLHASFSLRCKYSGGVPDKWEGITWLPLRHKKGFFFLDRVRPALGMRHLYKQSTEKQMIWKEKRAFFSCRSRERSVSLTVSCFVFYDNPYPPLLRPLLLSASFLGFISLWLNKHTHTHINAYPNQRCFFF